MRSAPQKQPIPKTATSRSSGQGGTMVLPSTAWTPLMSNVGSSWSGSAVSAVTMSGLLRLNSMGGYLLGTSEGLGQTIQQRDGLVWSRPPPTVHGFVRGG